MTVGEGVWTQTDRQKVGHTDDMMIAETLLNALVSRQQSSSWERRDEAMVNSAILTSDWRTGSAIGRTTGTPDNKISVRAKR